MGLGIQEINNIFRETKIEKILIRVLLKVIPDLIEKEIKRILNKDISKKNKVVFPNNKEIYF